MTYMTYTFKAREKKSHINPGFLSIYFEQSVDT